MKRLENGGYALTGRTGDTYDILAAPAWRAKQPLLDGLLIQASNSLAAPAFALNVLNNLGGKIFFDGSAAIDQALVKTLGVDSQELSMLARSATPGFPWDDLPPYFIHRAAQISRSARRGLLGDTLKIPPQSRRHIHQRHAWTPPALDRSLFFPNVDVDRLVAKSRKVRPQKQSNGLEARVVTAKNWVGLDRATGQPTKTYTVIAAPYGDVVTLHPGLPDPKYALSLKPN